jgi:predicted RNase H-like HicB family nuclease
MTNTPKQGYPYVLEKTNTGYCGFFPTITEATIIATGGSLEETLANLKEALEIHLKYVADDCGEMPDPFDEAGLIYPFSV